MQVITECNEQQRISLQQSMHRDCVVCRSARLKGLGIQVHANADGSVEGTFDCHPFYQGYHGILHGGVISAILDGAMTNCLFAHGKSGVTARLIIRFLKPVAADGTVTIKARLCDYSPPLYVLEAELSQDGNVLTQATAKFMDYE